MQRNRHRSSTAVAGWLIGAVVLTTVAGCSGQQPTTNSSDEQPTSDMQAMAGADLPAPPASAEWNLADASYLTMMIPHHRQALDMAELAEDRSDDPRVRAVAEAIDSGQSREIIVMATWLVDHGLPEPTFEDVEAMTSMAGSPGAMAGMLSPDQMTALAAADGADFDELFLEGMIQHHEGAVTMADELLGSGEDVRVTEMATDVIAAQSSEIRRMESLLSSP